MSYSLNRHLTERQPPLAASAEVDAITAGIIRGAFETICYEVATQLGRSVERVGGASTLHGSGARQSPERG